MPRGLPCDPPERDKLEGLLAAAGTWPWDRFVTRLYLKEEPEIFLGTILRTVPDTWVYLAEIQRTFHLPPRLRVAVVEGLAHLAHGRGLALAGRGDELFLRRRVVAPDNETKEPVLATLADREWILQGTSSLGLEPQEAREETDRPAGAAPRRAVSS